MGRVKNLHWLMVCAFTLVLSQLRSEQSGAQLREAPPSKAQLEYNENAKKKAKAKEADEEEVKEVRGKLKNITLSVGISRTLEFPFDIGPIYVTDDTLFTYRRVGEADKQRKLLITPKTPGSTDMTIHDTSLTPKFTYRVHVTREDTGRLISQLEEMVGDIEGIRIYESLGMIMIDGEILLPKDMTRIMRVIDAVKGRDAKKEIPIRNIATISKVTMNIIAERIEKEIGSPEITVKVLNNNLIMEGIAENNFEADRAVELAKTYLPEAFIEKNRGEGGEVRAKAQGGSGGMPSIIDFMQVRPGQAPPPSQDIKITMNYVELNNEYDKTFNFQWRPVTDDSGSGVNYNSAAGSFTASLVATVSSLFPKLQSLRTHGHARVLKQEQLIVQDAFGKPGAKESTIESSIDIYAPSPTGAANGQTTLQPIPVQNVTKIKAASIPGSNSIELGIQITLNSLLGLNNGSPVIAKNSIQTVVTIENGSSAALGGYAIDNAVAGYNREPVQNPLNANGQPSPGSPLFNLQRSKQYKHDKQQYVIFVTPEIIKTAAAGSDDITRKFRLNNNEK